MNPQSGTNALESAALADILMEKYGLLRKEIALHIGFYKGHIKNLQLMGTAILGGGAYVLSNPSLLPSSHNWWAWWMLVTFIPIIANYLLLDIVEAQYATIILSERLATIEEEVNCLAGRRLLIWETSVVPRFWQSFRPLPGVINPDWFLGILGWIIALSISVGIPSVVCYQLLWPIAITLWMHTAVIISGTFAVICTLTSGICMYKSILRLRNRPRDLFRKLAQQPLHNKEHQGG
jgi:hypothetical protein